MDVRLPGPLTAEQAARLRRDGTEVLYYRGGGRYVLSADPGFGTVLAPAEIAAADASPSYPNDAAAATLRQAFDVGPAPKRQGRPDATRVAAVLTLAYPGAARHLGAVLAATDFVLASRQFEGGVSLEGTVSLEALPALLAHPLILSAAPVREQAVLLSEHARFQHRVTPLNSTLATAAGLNGRGVVVGVGDGGELSGHPDIGRGVVRSTPWYNSTWGLHPDFVSGLIAGAGVVDPRYRGTAPDAELVVEMTSGIAYSAPSFLAEHGMTLTNNSYAPGFTCGTAGGYYAFAASVDGQLLGERDLLHVFAAGNSGRTTCGAHVAPFGTLSAGGQSAKNALTVGNATFTRERYASSSAGPTLDGRLKPEVMGVGHDVSSNDRNRSYAGGSGTSYSAPGVTAVLALLTEAYQRLHGGARPSGALLKAVACNTAADLGRPGPDFETGFGMVSGTAAVDVLRAGTHRSAMLPTGDTAVHDIAVAPDAEELRVLLYWHDRPGSTTNDAALLVDDLDVLILTPEGDTLHPWVLDPLDPISPATRGRDTLNNIEQVTLARPQPGVYRVLVTGRAQPYGQTDYVLTWDVTEPAVTLVQPFGGESLTPGEETAVVWEASPLQTGTWHLEYALDGGTWETIDRGVPNDAPWVSWTPPAGAGAYHLRITNEATGLRDETDAAVTLLAPPSDLRLGSLCGGGAEFSWAPVPGAVAYEVYRFDGDAMPVVALTDAPAATLAFDEKDLGIFSVAAVAESGRRSARAVAYVYDPTTDASTFQAAAPCNVPLPVTWEDIRLSERPRGVRVEWTVSREEGTDYFALERGRPGPGGEIRWETTGRIPARGEATSRKTYALDDPTAVGQLYYRIRLVDRDGTEDHSAVVAYEGPASSETLAVMFGVGGALRNDGEAAVTVALLDAAGRLVLRRRLAAGETSAWPSHLPGGVYALQWRTADGRGGVRRIVR